VPVVFSLLHKNTVIKKSAAIPDLEATTLQNELK
jgi:hypothetical protein